MAEKGMTDDLGRNALAVICRELAAAFAGRRGGEGEGFRFAASGFMPV